MQGGNVTGAYPVKCHIRADAAGGATRVDVYDDIGDGGWYGDGLTAKDFTAQLAAVKGPLDVHINSSGGNVNDGIAIANAVRDHPGRKRTIVDGMAASIASIIMQAGDERIVQPGAMVMVHEASAGGQGTAADFEKMAQVLDKHSENLARQYADRAGGTAEQWRSTMREETWYTAEEAVAAGLADRVGAGRAALPRGFDLAAFHAVPGRIVAHLSTMPLAADTPATGARHGAFTGTHTHPHAAMDGQGGTHEHEHTHQGDSDHAHTHPQSGDGDGMDEDARALLRALLAGGVTAPLILTAVQAAGVDESDWDGPHAMSLAAKSDDPAATYKQICAGRREGDPSQQDSWALPYKYPGKPVNRAGVKNALSRLPQTQGLTNQGAAQSLLQRLMRQLNPDYEPDDHAGVPAWLAAHHEEPAPVPAWLNAPEEATP